MNDNPTPVMTPCAMLEALEAKLDTLAQLLTRQDQGYADEATDHDTGHQAETFRRGIDHE